jgi:site-specific recombinase XerD
LQVDEKTASTALADPMASVRAYLAAEKSPGTRRAYAADWRAFHTWCESVKEPPLPARPETVARYLALLADQGLKASTIVRRCAAIRYAHKAAGHEPPTASEGVKATMRGIRRSIGTAVTRKEPAVASVLALMLERLPATLAGTRDRALLLIGFAAARRRSEIAALDVADIAFHRDGMIVHVRRSKTDQEAAGAEIPVPHGVRLRPVAALQAWLEASGITQGPLFRPIDRHGRLQPGRLTDRSIARIVKKAARGAGLDEAVFSGHSMRAGFVTSALEDEVDFFKVMNTTGHKDVRTLRVYDRRARGFAQHAGKGFL